MRKDDPRVEAYGAVDEANAALGLCRCSAPAEIAALLGTVQAELLHVGADLAAPEGERPGGLARVGEDEVAALERAIDHWTALVPPLRHFVLPAGGPAAAALHVARTTVRRAERRAVTLAGETECNPAVLRYLNRLSDLLFVLARVAAQQGGVAEEPWIPRR